MKETSTLAAQTPEPTVAPTQPAARRPQPDADSSVVTLEDGEPCLENPTDGGRWDWDMEAVSAVVRCQECGGSERVFREPDGRIFCEICLLRGPAQSLPGHG